jgi:hypothetical protein
MVQPLLILRLTALAPTVRFGFFNTTSAWSKPAVPVSNPHSRSAL